MVNRYNIDIISHVLEAANGGASKIQVMYKALLSYKPVKGLDRQHFRLILSPRTNMHGFLVREIARIATSNRRNKEERVVLHTHLFIPQNTRKFVL